jgi:hypothetical protein
MRLFHISVALWLVFTLVLMSGCNSSGVKIGAVTGRITKNGKPQVKVSVFLTPVDGGRPSEGLTNENGEYQMVYTRDQMGALVGKQRLTITTAPKIKNGDIVSQGSELVSKEVEITSGSNVFDFDLAAAGDQQAK